MASVLSSNAITSFAYSQPSGEKPIARQESWTFFSETLQSEMPITVYLPPGYDSQNRRYPVLYMLHGIGGTNDEWQYYGLFTEAEAMMAKGDLEPFIIVLPQGDQSYWVDHANGGPQWGKYVSEDVVMQIDRRYRTVPYFTHRGIGGLSMGADGALQIALNYPEFGIVGAHSPVLRPYSSASSFYGDKAYFDAHSPVTLIRQKTSLARSLVIQIDSGKSDPWLRNASSFHNQLTSLGIEHDWKMLSGTHDADYWTENASSFLRFYGTSFGLAFYDGGTYDFSGISTGDYSIESSVESAPGLVTTQPIAPLQPPQIIDTTPEM